MKELKPGTMDSIEITDKISKILMDFVVHNQKPFSKTLQNFVARGCHDIRANLVAVQILHEVKKYMEEK